MSNADTIQIILFCQLSLCNEARNNFLLKVIKHKIYIYITEENRIIAGVKRRNSSRVLIKGLEIITLPCEHIFSLMNFIVINKKHFQSNSAVHNIHSLSKSNPLRPVFRTLVFRPRNSSGG
jgi:hypothetical protein